MTTRRTRRLAIAVAAAAVLLGGLCLSEVVRYPRIARSAYLRHPLLLVAAGWSRLFPGSVTAEAVVLADAARVYPGATLYAYRFYLSDRPRDDRNIRDRIFSLIRKSTPRTDERIFWIVSASAKFGVVQDDWLVYEYKTGRLVGGPAEPSE